MTGLLAAMAARPETRRLLALVLEPNSSRRWRASQRERRKARLRAPTNVWFEAFRTPQKSHRSPLRLQHSPTVPNTVLVGDELADELAGGPTLIKVSDAARRGAGTLAACCMVFDY